MLGSLSNWMAHGTSVVLSIEARDLRRGGCWTLLEVKKEVFLGNTVSLQLLLMSPETLHSASNSGTLNLG